MTSTPASPLAFAQLFRRFASPAEDAAAETVARAHAARKRAYDLANGIEVDGVEDVALAFELCLSLPGAGLLLRGWLSDPHEKVRGLWLQVDGDLAPVERFTALFRPDIIGFRGLTHIRPGHRAGFSALQPVEPLDASETVRMVAVAETAKGLQAISSTQLIRRERTSVETILRELNTGACTPAELVRAAKPMLDSLTEGSRTLAWRDKRVESTGSPVAGLTLVIVAGDSAAALHPILSFLEMEPAARRLNIVIVGGGDEQDALAAATRPLRGDSRFGSLTTVYPAYGVSFGAAVREGLSYAAPGPVLIMTAEHLPPEGAWLADLIDAAFVNPNKVFTLDVAAFDGRGRSLSGVVGAIDLSRYEQDHGALVEHLSARSDHDLPGQVVGPLLGERDLLLREGLFDACYSVSDLCQADTLLALARAGVTVERLSGPQFTKLSMTDGGDGPAERLTNLYALGAAAGFSPAPTA